MTDVGVVGYGTIGKRVADAAASQPDMEVVGVAKRSPDYTAILAAEAGLDLYAADADSEHQFESADVPVAGRTTDLVDRSDVVVDATPSGIGEKNRTLYDDADTPAIFQGGESADIAETSFTARVNYADAIDARRVRVLSCNSTGMARLFAPLKERFGIDTVRASMVRRGGDPSQTDTGPIDDIIPDPLGESHHGPDVETVLPDLEVRTRGVKVPATRMHVQIVRISLSDPPEDVSAIRELLAAEPRLLLVGSRQGIEGCGDLKELGRDSDRPRSDLWENCIWAESLQLREDEVSLFQAIDQESIVVPENIDAIRAVAGDTDGEESRRTTDDVLGIGSLLAR